MGSKYRTTLKLSHTTELLKPLHYNHYNHQHSLSLTISIMSQVAVHDDTAHLLLLVEPKLISPTNTVW